MRRFLYSCNGWRPVKTCYRFMSVMQNPMAKETMQLVQQMAGTLNEVGKHIGIAKLQTELITNKDFLAKHDSLWQDDPNKAIDYQKRIARLEETLSEYDKFEESHKQSKDLLEMADSESDASLIQEVTTEVQALKEQVDAYFLRTLMSKSADRASCFIEINAGAGGAESCDFVSMLARMYIKWGESRDYSVSIVDEAKGDTAGYRSILIQVEGPYAYGWYKHEMGVHRLVRVSKYDTQGRRHTSFASVTVLSEEPNDDIPIQEINPRDLKIETMRAQGAGGQHVNRTESAIRLTHLPTGIVVSCQNQRSQHQNKAMAMKVLKARLVERERKIKATEKQELRSELPENAWGSQIRSYVLQPYQLIKDLRTGYERADVENVLEGDLHGFLEASLLHFK